MHINLFLTIRNSLAKELGLNRSAVVEKAVYELAKKYTPDAEHLKVYEDAMKTYPAKGVDQFDPFDKPKQKIGEWPMGVTFK